MKNKLELSLEVLDCSEIEVPKGYVAFKIKSQKGFESGKVYRGKFFTYKCVEFPFIEQQTFFLKGVWKQYNNRIIVIKQETFRKLEDDILFMLANENAPKVLYTATFYYKNDKGERKRYLIEVQKDSDKYIYGIDKDITSGSPYRRFLKRNIIGEITKTK